MAVSWPDDVDEIIGSDLAAALAYVTPAKGVVLSPMGPLGLRDREAGTVTVTSSLGLWKKLTRIRANPATAVAYHAREHGGVDRDDFVLVQGRARILPPDRDWLESITPQWERFLGPRERGWRGRLMRVHYWERVAIEIAVERVLVWRSADCEGEPEVYGAPRPEPPQPQRPPKGGTAPRVSASGLARHSARLPHGLLGWVDGDGLPIVVAAEASDGGESGAALEVAAAGLPPTRERRAGFTAHAFGPRLIGQDQRIYTGWLEVDGGAVRYAPHTKAGYRLPTSRLLFDLASGIATRRGMRGARRAGLA